MHDKQLGPLNSCLPVVRQFYGIKQHVAQSTNQVQDFSSSTNSVEDKSSTDSDVEEESSLLKRKYQTTKSAAKLGSKVLRIEEFHKNSRSWRFGLWQRISWDYLYPTASPTGWIQCMEECQNHYFWHHSSQYRPPKWCCCQTPETVLTKRSRRASVHWLSTPHSRPSSSALAGFLVPNRITVI